MVSSSHLKLEDYDRDKENIIYKSNEYETFDTLKYEMAAKLLLLLYNNVIKKILYETKNIDSLELFIILLVLYIFQIKHVTYLINSF